MAAARLLLTKIMVMSLLATVVDPGLEPNQPNQRMKTSSASRGMLWPRIGLILPSLVDLPQPKTTDRQTDGTYLLITIPI